MEWAVLLMAYGGPDSLDDVEPYLLDVRGGRETPRHLVEEIRGRYAKIGGRSPLLGITKAQARSLEETLNQTANDGNHFRVFVGMRHWRPYIREAIQEICDARLNHIVAISMTPFSSKMSTGAYQQKLFHALEEAGFNSDCQVRIVDHWYENQLFLQSVADKVSQALECFPEPARHDVRVLFTAHSLPAVIMEQGDHYAEQFVQAARMVADILHLPEQRWQVGYQSAGAQSTRWLGPSLEEMLEDLAKRGEKNVLVAPIGFIADHVEILFDIDIEAKELAGELGIHLERTESQNDSPSFTRALANVVEAKIRE